MKYMGSRMVWATQYVVEDHKDLYMTFSNRVPDTIKMKKSHRADIRRVIGVVR